MLTWPLAITSGFGGALLAASNHMPVDLAGVDPLVLAAGGTLLGTGAGLIVAFILETTLWGLSVRSQRYSLAQKDRVLADRILAYRVDPSLDNEKVMLTGSRIQRWGVC